MFASIQGGAGAAVRALDGVAQVIGAIGIAGGISLIAGGAKAAWDQVSAVEQATVALRAYEKDASAVDKVLQELLDYARSDMGVLFQRQDLYAAAQGLKVMGAETSNLTRYVEIMSRSVGVGAGNWDELNQVIGRVGSTGRLAGEDFDMLTKMGYQLDDSLRNTNITWEELFANLDRGIPADAMLGQANTIEGMMIRLQSAIRGIGTAFLGLDADTSQFIEGGLGDQLTDWLSDAPGMIRNFQGAASELGGAIVGVIDFVANMVGAFRMLPEPVQNAATTVLKLVAAFGALRVAGRAMGMIGALTGLGGLAGGLGGLLSGTGGAAGGAKGLSAAIGGLLGKINPLGLAIGGVIALGASWVNSFMDQQRAVNDYNASVTTLTATLEGLRRQGLKDRATQGEGLAGMFDDIDERSGAMMDDWRNSVEMYSDEWERLQNFQEVTLESQTQLNSLLNEALNDPSIDVDAWMNWATSLLMGAENAEELKSAVDLILTTPLSDFAYENTDAMNGLGDAMVKVGATAAEVAEIFADLPSQVDDLRIDGLDKQADDLERLGRAMEQAFTPKMLPGASGEYVIVDELDVANVEGLATSWERISDALASGDFDNARLMADVMTVLSSDMSLDDKALAIEQISLNLADYSTALTASEEAMRDWLAEGENILAFWLEFDAQMNQGAAMLDGSQAQLDAMQQKADFRALVQFTLDVNNAAAALDRALYYFEQIDALGQRSASSASIAEALVGKPGEWAAIDDLVTSGRISWEQYNQTVASGYSIMESNARVQEHLNKMRADQLPLLEAEQLAYEKQIAAISELEPLEQRRVLAMQDSAYQAQIASMYSTAYSASLGEIPEDVATSIIVSAAEADPILKDLLLNFGLIEEGADGTISVNFPDGPTVQDTIMELTDSIDALIETLGGVAPASAAAVEAMRNIGSAAGDVARNIFGNLPTQPTHGTTGVPVVTGLPNAGSGPAMEDQTITITADDSAVRETIAQVSAMMAVVGAMESTVRILADDSAVRETISQVSAMMAVVSSMTATVRIMGDASHALGVIAGMRAYNGMTLATSYTDIVTRRIDSGSPIKGFASGGVVRDDMVLVGENGPEFVRLPYGSEVFSNQESRSMMRSTEYARPASTSGTNGSGRQAEGTTVTVDFSGATFNNTSREEMNAWAEEALIPGIARAIGDRRTGAGVSTS